MTKLKVKSKTILIIVGIIILLAGIGVILRFTILAPQSEKIEKSLTNIGKLYYEEFLYNQLTTALEEEEYIDYQEKYKETGLTTNITNIKVPANEKIQDAVTKFEKNEGKTCNMDNTRITIYTKDPYGKTDFEVKVTPDCE